MGTEGSMTRKGLCWQTQFFESDLQDLQNQSQFNISNDPVACLQTGVGGMPNFPSEDAELRDDFRSSESLGKAQLFQLRTKDVLGFRFGADSAGHVQYIAALNRIVF